MLILIALLGIFFGVCCLSHPSHTLKVYGALGLKLLLMGLGSLVLGSCLLGYLIGS